MSRSFSAFGLRCQRRQLQNSPAAARGDRVVRKMEEIGRGQWACRSMHHSSYCLYNGDTSYECYDKIRATK